MKAYSYDLRQRILRAVDQGRPRKEIVSMFGVSLATIKRYLKQRRETGDVQAKPIPGRPAKKGPALQAGLKEQLEAHPDVTLEQHCSLWKAEHGMQVSPATMSRAIYRLDWTRKKKTLGASERSEEARAVGRKQAKALDARQLVFLNECGSHIALTPLYARSPKGERAYGSVPRNRRANVTLLASLSLQGMGEALMLEGSADSHVFELYIEQVLSPSLLPGQIVVMDNLSMHTGEKVCQALEARGCRLLFLPSSSPDLSPIEEAFSTLKTFLRRAQARTHEALQEALDKASSEDQLLMPTRVIESTRCSVAVRALLTSCLTDAVPSGVGSGPRRVAASLAGRIGAEAGVLPAEPRSCSSPAQSFSHSP